MIVDGIYINYASSENEAWQMIDNLAKCKNCSCFEVHDLFTGLCHYLEVHNNKCFEVSVNDTCEEFIAKDKKVEYWINKLVEMALEYSGDNDFIRQLEYHEKNGTQDQFLGM